MLISARNIFCEKVWVEFLRKVIWDVFFSIPFPHENMTIDMYIALKAEMMVFLGVKKYVSDMDHDVTKTLHLMMVLSFYITPSSTIRVCPK